MVTKGKHLFMIIRGRYISEKRKGVHGINLSSIYIQNKWIFKSMAKPNRGLTDNRTQSFDTRKKPWRKKILLVFFLHKYHESFHHYWKLITEINALTGDNYRRQWRWGWTKACDRFISHFIGASHDRVTVYMLPISGGIYGAPRIPIHLPMISLIMSCQMCQ